MLVTIRGTLGSGAPEIGKQVARIINGDYVDREILEEIAKLIGQPVEQAVKWEQISPRLVKRIMDALSNAIEKFGSSDSDYKPNREEPSKNNRYFEALKSVVESLAMEDKVVIQGRGSQFILRHHPSALHVLVAAPLKERIKRVMSTSGMNEDGARKLIEEHDQSRRLFIRKFFKHDIQNYDYYDLVVNTGKITFDVSARIIANAVIEKNPW